METVTDEYAASVTEKTDQYLAAVESCTALLPAAVRQHRTGEFDETLALMDSRESACDAHLRELRTLLGEADPNYTDVYLRSGDVMELYVRVEAVPNAAEAFVREIAAVDSPVRLGTLEGLIEMTGLAMRATDLLSKATATYVSSMVSEGATADLTDQVERIDRLESRADDRKYRLVEQAFDRHETAEAALLRDQIELLDATVDAAEDAADHLLFMSSSQH